VGTEPIKTQGAGGQGS